ncbi:MAG: sulfotransferase family protein [Pseudomonadota bacterium]
MLKVIGAGLSRTGTHSLHLALQMLGLRSIHYDQARLNDILFGETQHPDFRRYDDVEAVCDLPAALFYRELLDAYPDAKVVLTTRDLESWWRSVQVHFSVVAAVPEEERFVVRALRRLGVAQPRAEHDVFRRRLRNYAYGSPTPSEFLYKKRFVEHNEAVISSVPPDRLLILNFGAGDGWAKLCAFLHADAPDCPFPAAATTDYANPAPWLHHSR